MKVVITGANSFIGTYLAKRAGELGWESVLVLRSEQRIPKTKNCKLIVLPMEAYDRLGDLAGPCDCFVHLAWNGPHKEQITEDSICRPNTEYGRAKLAFYEAIACICTENNISYKEPRFFSLYGPGDFSGTMILSILRDMLANRPCRLSECRQMWDYLYIDDAIEGLIRLCKEPCPDGVYNFGSGDTRPLRGFVEEMARLTQTSSKLLYGALPYPATGMVSIWPDVSKLKRELHWEPKVPFAEGIRTILESISNGIMI